jgi:hypothetical protein
MPWNWVYISQNINITPKNILDNLDKPWDWGCVYKNRFCCDIYFQFEEHKKILVKRFLNKCYKELLVKLFLNKCWEELIKVSCRPDRTIQWNEGAVEQYPEI